MADDSLSEYTFSGQYKSPYPVVRLYDRIFQDLNKYSSLEFLNQFDSETLKKMVIPIDLDFKISNVAEVIRHNNEETLEMEDSIVLSIAFCQFLWILCDIAIRSIDRIIAIAEAENYGKSKDDLIRENEEILRKNDAEIKEILDNWGICEEPIKFRMQISRNNELLKDESFLDKMGKELLYDLSLLPNETIHLDFRNFSILNMEDGYGQVANACFIKGISFILIHELSHIILKHDPVAPTLENETEADMNSFSTIYGEVPDEERFTAIVGIICMLFALVIKDFGCLGDEFHQREDIRLFSMLDLVSEENIKYSWLTAYLFSLWAQMNKVDDFPCVHFSDPTAIDQIKEFFYNL